MTGSIGAFAGMFLGPYPEPGREFPISLETEDRDILQVCVELELELESFLDDDSCESCDGFLVTVQEFRRRWS